mmetsp:Transcript_28228/g.47329  ORF Transcript_28228/g.47329 Transcript_28228/m.47329 type:complete len:603 (-) Transcript_28228:3308-5116(-)
MGCCGPSKRNPGPTVSMDGVAFAARRKNSGDSAFSKNFTPPVVFPPQPSSAKSLSKLCNAGDVGQFVPSHSFKTMQQLQNQVAASTLPFVYESTVLPGFNANNETDRKECQDAALIIESLVDLDSVGMACVFDGHGINGRKCSQFAKKFFPRYIYQRIMQDCTFDEACAGACPEAEEKLANNQTYDVSNSGTTATVVMLKETELMVTWVGDSSAVVGRRVDGKITGQLLTVDHKPSNSLERRRIEQSGGLVRNVNGESVDRVFSRNAWLQGVLTPGLAMSRSIGDMEATDLGCIPTADVSMFDITEEDDFVIVATDGLWDVFAPQEAAEFISKYSDKYKEADSKPAGHGEEPRYTLASKALGLKAQKRWTNTFAKHGSTVDDTTVVIVWLKEKYGKVFSEQVKAEKENKLRDLRNRKPVCFNRPTPSASFLHRQSSFHPPGGGRSFREHTTHLSLEHSTSNPTHSATIPIHSVSVPHPHNSQDTAHSADHQLHTPQTESGTELSLSVRAISDVVPINESQHHAPQLLPSPHVPSPTLLSDSNNSMTPADSMDGRQDSDESSQEMIDWRQVVVMSRKPVTVSVDESFVAHRDRVRRMERVAPR